MDNKFYKEIIMNSHIGYAYHKILCDDRGIPCDYEFIDVNSTFEAITGLKGKDIIGKRVTEVIPGIKSDTFNWIGIYGDIALQGGKREFDQYSSALGRSYRVSAYSPVKNYFTTDFFDISKEVLQNEALKRLVQSSERLLRLNDGILDYSQVAEDCLLLAQAKLAYLYVIDDDGSSSEVVGAAGDQATQIQATFSLSPEGANRFFETKNPDHLAGSHPLIKIDALRDLATPGIPATVISSLEKSMDLGEIILVRIDTKEKVLGYFILIMAAGQAFMNTDLVETFARQVGMTMSRIEAEDKLKNFQMLLRASLNSPQDMIILSIDKN
ncbi:MAG: hypothetical protein V1761_05510, partial [bacterium]